MNDIEIGHQKVLRSQKMVWPVAMESTHMYYIGKLFESSVWAGAVVFCYIDWS